MYLIFTLWSQKVFNSKFYVDKTNFTVASLNNETSYVIYENLI